MEFENSLVERFGSDVGNWLVNEVRWFVFSDCADLRNIHNVRVADVSNPEQVQEFDALRGRQIAEHQVWHSSGKCFWLGLNHS